MNTPARRDGTPDRNRNTSRAAKDRNPRAPRSDNRTDARSDRRTDSRPDRRSEGRSDFRTDRRTEGRSDHRPDRRTEGRADRRSEGRSDFRTDRRSEGRPDHRSDRRTEGRPDYRADRRTEGRTDRRTDARPDRRTDARPDRRAETSTPDAAKKTHRKGTTLNKRGRPAAPKPAAKRPTPNPTISNAKPARHQHRDAGPTQLPAGEGVRLQKVLAQAGVASRRAAEELIDAGRVEVDGKIVIEQGLRVDPENTVIRVDGVRVVVKKDLVHLVLNKPRGWQSTMSDDLGRPCVGDIVSERIAAGQRLFHVGRLDADTEGLLLLTNDGELAHRLMHPSFEVAKTYLATVKGELPRGVGKKLKEGVELEDGPASVDEFALLEVFNGQSRVRLELHEGRKHIVRRHLDAVGHPVIRLVRTNIGPVALGDQRPGTLRVLGRKEVGGLYEAVGL